MKKFVTGVLNISGCFYRKRCFAMNQYRWNDLVDWFGRKCRFPFVAFFDLNVQDFHSGSGNLVDLLSNRTDRMTKHPLTDQGIEKFQADYKAVFGE